MSKCVFAAVTAVGLCVATSSALAQDPSAATPGGDITADEATPRPPVVVQAPSEPPRRKGKRQITPASTGAPAAPGGSDLAGTVVVEGPAVAPFTLGQLDLIGGATITNEAMWTYNKQSLDKALDILPGVSIQQSGNSRNERDIQVRGFDRFRVPLYMDGVRVYLPADNRLDFGRFLTPDLAEVQVQKGYVSVLNGPGGMGGAINLVSRKPTKEIELEGRAGLVMNGDLDDMNQWSSYAYAGTRQKGYYAQVSGTIIDQDHFSLSDDFRPASPSTTPGYLPGYPYEDGGDRYRSYFEDWRINAKVGITPNATDEYSINYTTQANERGSPPHVNRQAVQGYFFGATERHWTWDDWSTSQLSWLSKTQLGDASYIKTNLSYSTFGSDLQFHNDGSYTTRFLDSIYDDYNYGGFVELGTELIPMNTLKGAIHYRRDTHKEWDLDYDATPLSGPFTGRSPTETSREETWSLAIENTFHATPFLDFITGISYDWNEVLQAEFTNSSAPTVVLSQPETPSVDAWNWQGAAVLSYSRTGTAHASVSSRTRFPTLFERYSTRFGTRAVDPNLDPERATNYELGVSDTFGDVKFSGAVFYSDIKDSIQNVFYAANGNNSIIGINADAETYGLELSADWNVTRTLRIGGNYTYIERDVDYASASFTPFGNANQQAAQLGSVAVYKPEGTPAHKAFLYLSWQALPYLTLTPSLELSSDRTVLITDCRTTLTNNGNMSALQNTGGCPGASARSPAAARPNFTDIGAYALVNFNAEYAFNDNATLSLGATNLFDEDYSLADGFPEPGRQFFANARVRF
ncbi:TonB-dependent receptor [Hyphomicrobium sp.]|uniref:TonB-dependent receptor plug domain-containing protein n=1 Tax=Hyphomicrobium sp. TaxID=82 RepID=UPI0025C4D1A8|nr:TonB-dependent receptor [Hyphomicrobium sp.]MCC7252299.1 TonB-dependent receptor [Hyphomicrobium sp.]